MADRSKKPKNGPPAGEAAGEGAAGRVKYNASVKLTQVFKEQLEAVADDLDLYPGELIEQRIGQFVRTEWKRILTEKLRKADQSGV